MKKALVICVILLFLGVGFQPATANDESNVTLSTDKEEENFILEKNPIPLPFGFILVKTRVWHPLYNKWANAQFIKISCEDLDTCDIRYARTGLFAFHLFMFLQNGHDYKIIHHHPWLEGEEEIVNDLNFYHWVDLRMWA